jgi:thermostable 8-oxoguanine DNA glycosylase
MSIGIGGLICEPMLAQPNSIDRPAFSPDAEVIPGVIFGRPEWVPSPAFWASLAAHESHATDRYVSPPGTPLVDDIIFCLLGGYGIRMELNQAAWKHLKAAGILSNGLKPSADSIESLLCERLDVEGRRVRYRFPRQRAHRVAFALEFLHDNPLDHLDPLQLRNSLMAIPGIGPKTASWIVRNWTGTDEVAILDVHVIRAGQLIGLFPKHIRLPRDYSVLEARFLEFSHALNVRASLLDAIIWREMRALTS